MLLLSLLLLIVLVSFALTSTVIETVECQDLQNCEKCPSRSIGISIGFGIVMVNTEQSGDRPQLRILLTRPTGPSTVAAPILDLDQGYPGWQHVLPLQTTTITKTEEKKTRNHYIMYFFILRHNTHLPRSAHGDAQTLLSSSTEASRPTPDSLTTTIPHRAISLVIFSPHPPVFAFLLLNSRMATVFPTPVRPCSCPGDHIPSSPYGLSSMVARWYTNLLPDQKGRCSLWLPLV